MARPISRKLCCEALESRRLLTQWNVFPSGGAPTAPVKVKFEPIVDAAEHSLSNIRKKDDMTKELIYDDGTGAGQTTGLSVENLEQIEIVGGSLRDSIELVTGLHTLLPLTLLEVYSKAGNDWIVGAPSIVMFGGSIPQYDGGSDGDTIQGGDGREKIIWRRGRRRLPLWT